MVEDFRLAKQLLKKRKEKIGRQESEEREKSNGEKSPEPIIASNQGRRNSISKNDHEGRRNSGDNQVDDIKLARELLKRKKNQNSGSPFQISQENDDAGVGKVEDREKAPEVNSKKYIPKQEKVDDIKLAKELLKRKKEKGRSPSPSYQDSRTLSPDMSNSDPGKIQWLENDANARRRNSVPKQEKVDDIKLARELLKKKKEKALRSPSPTFQDPRVPSPDKSNSSSGKTHGIEKESEINRKKYIPRQEKVDDIKLAKELLKKKKEKDMRSPSPNYQDSRTPSPDKSNSSPGKIQVPEKAHEVKSKKYIPRQEKVDDIKLAKELLKKKKQKGMSSSSPTYQDSRTPSPDDKSNSDLGKMPEKIPDAKRRTIPKQEKALDIKLAKELLRKRKQPREKSHIQSPEPISESPEPEKETHAPKEESINIENYNKVRKRGVGKLSGNEWNQEKKQLGSAPKAKKVDDLDMARQLLRRRKKSDDRMEQHMKTKTEPVEGERDLTNREKEVPVQKMKKRHLAGHYVDEQGELCFVIFRFFYFSSKNFKEFQRFQTKK